MDSVSLVLPFDCMCVGTDSTPGHWAHQPTKLYYNGLPHAEIMGGGVPAQNGIDRESIHI